MLSVLEVTLKMKDFFLEKILQNNSANYAHVFSAMEQSHEILINQKHSFLIHCVQSNSFIAESDEENKKVDSFCRMFKKFDILRIQTTNENVFNIIKPNFLYNYDCFQAIFPPKSLQKDENLQLLKEKDLDYVCKSYGLEKYITQLYERNRLFGYYENTDFIGYASFHIDESLGALFVKPEFRGKGYGKKIMKALAFCCKNPTKYSQILTTNTESINLHKRIGCEISTKKVFWAYNKEFEY